MTTPREVISESSMVLTQCMLKLVQGDSSRRRRLGASSSPPRHRRDALLHFSTSFATASFRADAPREARPAALQADALPAVRRRGAAVGLRGQRIKAASRLRQRGRGWSVFRFWAVSRVASMASSDAPRRRRGGVVTGLRPSQVLDVEPLEPIAMELDPEVRDAAREMNLNVTRSS